MERENDNRTPRDRVSDDFRDMLMNMEDMSSGRGFNPGVVDNLPLAMAYVPRQKWRNAYSPEEALSRGTLFSELDLPFYPPRVCGGGRK